MNAHQRRVKARKRRRELNVMAASFFDVLPKCWSGKVPRASPDTEKDLQKYFDVVRPQRVVVPLGGVWLPEL